MRSQPSTPPVDDAPAELLESGHLWMLEDVAGEGFRFRLRDSGMIQFGDADRVYDSPDELPARYRHAVRHVQTHLDREALRAAVDDVEGIVFFGIATQYQGVDYDWDRLPSFLGCDIWSDEAEAFRPPDAVDGIFDRLGLQAVNAIEQEVRARDFNPETYTIPQSAWYDGPAAGVVIRNKQGHRARLTNPNIQATASTGANETSETAVEDLVAAYGTDQRFERLSQRLVARRQPITVDTLLERAFEGIVRELPAQTVDGRGLDMGAFRSALAARTQEYINDR
jgi:hypothetical protein